MTLKTGVMMLKIQICISVCYLLVKKSKQSTFKKQIHCNRLEQAGSMHSVFAKVLILSLLKVTFFG